jgi:hypothetical protein
MNLIDLRLKTIWGSINEQSKKVKKSGIIGGSLPHPSTAWIKDMAAPHAMIFEWHSPGLLFSLTLRYKLDRPASKDNLGQC